MDTFFLICAGLGGTLLVCQVAAGMLGIGGDHSVDHDTGGDHDADHDHMNAWFLGVLTFRSVVAGLTFFGLGGLTAAYYELPAPATLAAAVFAGAAALYAVAAIMKGFRQLKHDGTARIDSAIGSTGTVYLRVPGGNAGPGKVTLTVQNRTVECEAFSAATEIPTGAAVRVVAVRGPTAVEVEPVT